MLTIVCIGCRSRRTYACRSPNHRFKWFKSFKLNHNFKCLYRSWRLFVANSCLFLTVFLHLFKTIYFSVQTINKTFFCLFYYYFIYYSIFLIIKQKFFHSINCSLICCSLLMIESLIVWFLCEHNWHSNWVEIKSRDRIQSHFKHSFLIWFSAILLAKAKRLFHK